MARLTVTTGACPVCDRDVARTVSNVLSMQTETYHCPHHGAISYEPHRLTSGFLATHEEVIDVGVVQPLTGVEIVH